MSATLPTEPDLQGSASSRPPQVLNGRGPLWVTDAVCSIVEGKTPLWWYAAIALSGSLAAAGGACILYMICTGVGVWGSNSPAFWAWDITNFIFWVSMAHAGSFISAVLFLTRQKWSLSVSRAAEAMTVFAIVCAGVYPAIHIGRVWYVWFLAPIPNNFGMWPNFSSPLLWDVFAVTSYLTVSSLFWFAGMVPDLAVLRDRATTRVRKFCYGIVSLGWLGTARQWRHYEMMYVVLAGLTSVLVVTVTTIVASDCATSVIPGWHATIFPFYFMVGAVYSGSATVLTLLIPLRALYPQLKDLITPAQLEKVGMLLLMMGSCVGYVYVIELFNAWYSGNVFERGAFWERFTGTASWYAITCLSINLTIPQLFWFKRVRTCLPLVFVLAILCNVGMWFERFMIVTTSLLHDFLPSAWGNFHPSIVDIVTAVGTVGIFFTLFLLFIRFVPIMSMNELKAALPGTQPHHSGGGKH
jgi:molybdopterin-containing oxidoreductase family membrane subunit